MTIKDVLRETAGAGCSPNDVPLDDKKPPRAKNWQSLETWKAMAPTILLGPVEQRPRSVVQRLALLTAFACACSIIVLTFGRSITVKRVKKAVPPTLTVVQGSEKLTVLQQSLLNLMPFKVGGWVRNETSSDLWNDTNVGNSTVQTYVSTYRLGNDRVQLWAVRVPEVNNESPLNNFENLTRAVHTDRGVIDIAPKTFDLFGRYAVAFDYTPARPTDQALILTNQAFAPESPHTTSWYQAPYVVTVAADTKADRDRFVSSLLKMSANK